MVTRKTVKLFIEGGGAGTPNTAQLQAKMREAFHKLLKSYGMKNMPRIVVCGGRAQAYDHFINSHDCIPVLLIDSERPIASSQYWNRPWAFLKAHESFNWSANLSDT